MCSAIPPKLLGNVGLDNTQLLHLLQPLLLLLQHLVLAKMLNILRMRQILLARILVVKALKMMNLVLVLVVAVVSWAVAEVRQFEPCGGANGVFGKGDAAAAVFVEDVEDFLHGFVFLVGRDVVGGFVLEAVGFEEVFARPLVAAVVVVEVEEGAGVEEFDVVLLYDIKV